jgi:hypothetical protein
VQGAPAGVAGDLPGDVQDAVAQPLGFADGVLAVEGQQPRPGEDVVSKQRQLKPRGVRPGGAEWEVSGTGGLRVLKRSSTSAC